MSTTAYFCMEYGLDPALDIYAGGLGVLAGDFLKAAHDLEEDLIGVGILWTEGYTEQVIEEGKPIDRFQHHNYDFLEDVGISFQIKIGDSEVKCKIYKTEEFGNSPLYLLDTCLEENTKELGRITARLYPEDRKMALLQRLAFGKGSLKILSEVGLEPDVYHLNESDSVFVGLEIFRKAFENDGFESALDRTRKKVR